MNSDEWIIKLPNPETGWRWLVEGKDYPQKGDQYTPNHGKSWEVRTCDSEQLYQTPLFLPHRRRI